MGREVVGCFEISISQNKEGSAVKLICPCPGNNFYDRTTRFAGISAEIVGLDRELLNAFRGVVLQEAAHGVVFVFSAIHREVEISAGRTVDGYGTHAANCGANSGGKNGERREGSLEQGETGHLLGSQYWPEFQKKWFRLRGSSRLRAAWWTQTADTGRS